MISGVLNLFGRYAPNRTFIAIMLSALSGPLYAMLIPTIVRAIAEDDPNFVLQDKVGDFLGLHVSHSNFAALFFCCCILALVCKSTSDFLLIQTSLDVRFLLRESLYRRIAEAPIAHLERMGNGRLLQALSGDVFAVVVGAQVLPQLISNAVLVIAMLGYVAMIDLKVLIYVICVLVFGSVTYQIPFIFGVARFTRARRFDVELQEAFEGLVCGAKELKVDSTKRFIFEQEVLFRAEKDARELELSSMTFIRIANYYGGMLSLFAVGGLAFVYASYHHIATEDALAAVMILFYLTGPIAALLNIAPQLAQSKVATKRLDELYADLPSENISPASAPMGEWHVLHLQDVVYSHIGEQADVPGFKVGPVTLDILRGQILFISGGNGSGKSTLAKLISQHYQPRAGRVKVDGHVLGLESIAAFRNEIACVYPDYYLFGNVLHRQSMAPEFRNLVSYYIGQLGLADKVEFSGGRFSTLRLSDGQRRRLALLIAIVENKALYLFDEWAANQDSQFKEVFYYQILPFLRSRNSSVVVVSHDERYFDAADRVVFMDSGSIVRSSTWPLAGPVSRN